MATMYSGFATKKLETLYNTMLKKAVNMMTLKILFYQGSGDFLTDELREQVQDERQWS